jgi:hypothetical protein
LIIQCVDQTAIVWRGRQEFLGPSVSRHEYDNGPKDSDNCQVCFEFAQAAISGAVRVVLNEAAGASPPS